MNRPHARAGQPYDYPIDFAGDEPKDVEDMEQISGDILACAAWFFVVMLALFLIFAITGYWSMT